MNRTRSIVVLVSLLTLALGGCMSPPERALSKEEPPYATLVTGQNPLHPDKFIVKKGEVYSSGKDIVRYYEGQRGHALNLLLLSGGGQNGSFGAGLLKGWTASGTRPEFDIVTGVSTGALLATHAFLGTPADDAVLEELFTGVTSGNIYKRRGWLGVLGGADSLLKTDPLKALIAEHITAEVLERVAAEQRKGRRLVVGTTNLDYNQTWVWNLGAIAEAGGPDALELYRKVLRASSAFPIMFPPVEIDGHLFADGAVRDNILVIGLQGDEPPGPPLHGPGNVFVVENGRVANPPHAVKKGLVDIASATIGEMMGSSNQGLMIRSYFATEVHGYNFHTIAVPDDVDIGTNPLAFDQTQMRAGFDAGFELGKRGTASWSDVPTLIGDFPPWTMGEIKEKL